MTDPGNLNRGPHHAALRVRRAGDALWVALGGGCASPDRTGVRGQNSRTARESRHTVVVVTHELASIFAISANSVFLDAAPKTQLATVDPSDLRDKSLDFSVRNFLMRGAVTPASSV